jgi:hypothetical protein
MIILKLIYIILILNLFNIIILINNKNLYNDKLIETLLDKNSRDYKRFRKIKRITKNGGTSGSKLGTDILGIVKLLLLSFEDGYYLIDAAIDLPDDIKKEPNITKIKELPSISSTFT